MSIEGGVYSEIFSGELTRNIRVKELLYSKKSRYQQIDVIDTYHFGVTLLLDGRFQTSERDEFFYHESLVHPAMMTHESPERVLIIGGGDGGTLEEVTKYHDVKRITMVELDWEVIEVSERYLKSISGSAFEDPRLELIIEDGRRFLEGVQDNYDIIILDLTDPVGPSKYLYTKEFYRICSNVLAPGGILGLHNDSPFYYSEAFNVISKTLDSVFPYKRLYLSFIIGYMLDFAFSICSFLPIPEPSPEVIHQRFEERKIGGLNFYSPDMHSRLFVLPGYVNQILQRRCEISTDKSPYIFNEEKLFSEPMI